MSRNDAGGWLTSGGRRREAGLVNAKQPGKWHSSTYRADYITNYFYLYVAFTLCCGLSLSR